jgi:hypothetical protein
MTHSSLNLLQAVYVSDGGIVRGSRNFGEAVWKRFTASKEVALYCSALVAAFAARESGPLVEGPDRVVGEMVRAVRA